MLLIKTASRWSWCRGIYFLLNPEALQPWASFFRDQLRDKILNWYKPVSLHHIPDNHGGIPGILAGFNHCIADFHCPQQTANCTNFLGLQRPFNLLKMLFGKFFYIWSVMQETSKTQIKPCSNANIILFWSIILTSQMLVASFVV